MKIQYTTALGLGKANIERLNTINAIIDQYLADGYIMTLRQLYYQLVSREVIPNNVKEYSKLSILLKKGRMAGIVDWAAIEDRGRQPRLPYHVDSVADALNDTYEQYRLDRQAGQPYYIEIWVEKDALSNVMSRVTNEYHVRLMVNKGYSSCSAMHDAYLRFYRHLKYSKQKGKILYFGDHDPSGKDMVRDIRDRLCEFGLDESVIEVLNPALTMDQVRTYELPENPAKITDPRAAWYIQEYGQHSWELDALEPPILIDIVTQSLMEYMDQDIYQERLGLEDEQKQIILRIKEENE
jgi:hypothetical protein